MNFVSYKTKTKVNLDLVVSLDMKEDKTRTGVFFKITFIVPGATMPVQWKFEDKQEAKEVYDYIVGKYVDSLEFQIALIKETQEK